MFSWLLFWMFFFECLFACAVHNCRKDSRCAAKCCEEFSAGKINRTMSGGKPPQPPKRLRCLTFWYTFTLPNRLGGGLYLQPANGVMAQLVSALP